MSTEWISKGLAANRAKRRSLRGTPKHSKQRKATAFDFRWLRRLAKEFGL